MYCNYSSEKKFGSEITYIIPNELFNEEIEVRSIEEWYIKYLNPKGKTPHIDSRIFIEDLLNSEKHYLELIKYGWKPQQAREVLPLATKSELIMTGFVSDWKDLFNKRTSIIAETGIPHPDMSNLCDPLYKEFVGKKFINGI